MMDTNNNENNSYDENALLVYTPIRENMSFRMKKQKGAMIVLPKFFTFYHSKKNKKVTFV